MDLETSIRFSCPDNVLDDVLDLSTHTGRWSNRPPTPLGRAHTFSSFDAVLSPRDVELQIPNRSFRSVHELLSRPPSLFESSFFSSRVQDVSQTQFPHVSLVNEPRMFAEMFGWCSPRSHMASSISVPNSDVALEDKMAKDRARENHNAIVSSLCIFLSFFSPSF